MLLRIELVSYVKAEVRCVNHQEGIQRLVIQPVTI